MNGHDDSITSSSTDTSPSKPLATPKGLPSLNGKPSDIAAKAKADSRSSTPRQGTQAQSDTQKALEGAVRDLRVRCMDSTGLHCAGPFAFVHGQRMRCICGTLTVLTAFLQELEVGRRLIGWIDCRRTCWLRRAGGRKQRRT